MNSEEIGQSLSNDQTFKSHEQSTQRAILTRHRTQNIFQK